MSDKSRNPQADIRKRQINNIDLNYTVAEYGRYFIVTVHRNGPGKVVKFYYRPTKASLLRVNRVQRLLIRRLVGRYVVDAPLPDDADPRFAMLLAAATEAWPMLPDFSTPAACPICGATTSHDAPKVGAFQGRIFQCGAIVCDLGSGGWEVTLYCKKTADILAERADEVRRLRRELDAVAELAEEELGEWIAVSPLYVPERLAALHSIYHRAAARAADPGAAETVTVGAVLGSGSAANGHNGAS